MDCLLIVDGNYYRLQAFDLLLLSTREQCGQTTGSISDLLLPKIIDANICAGCLKGKYI
jgi:hypothetical protein